MVSNKQSKKKPNLKKIRAEMECDLKANWKRNESEKKVVNYGKRIEAELKRIESGNGVRLGVRIACGISFFMVRNYGLTAGAELKQMRAFML